MYDYQGRLLGRSSNGNGKSLILRENKMHQDNNYKQMEEALLKEADLLIEKAKSQGEKALFNLFKSAILKKYKDQ